MDETETPPGGAKGQKVSTVQPGDVRLQARLTGSPVLHGTGLLSLKTSCYRVVLPDRLGSLQNYCHLFVPKHYSYIQGATDIHSDRLV